MIPECYIPPSKSSSRRSTNPLPPATVTNINRPSPLMPSSNNNGPLVPSFSHPGSSFPPPSSSPPLKSPQPPSSHVGTAVTPALGPPQSSAPGPSLSDFDQIDFQSGPSNYLHPNMGHQPAPFYPHSVPSVPTDDQTLNPYQIHQQQFQKGETRQPFMPQNQIFRGPFGDSQPTDSLGSSLYPSHLSSSSSDAPPSSSSPTLWLSPFAAALSSLSHLSSSSHPSNSDQIGGGQFHGISSGLPIGHALTAAIEAEGHVRKGISKARSWWPSWLENLKGYFAVSHYSVGQKLLAVFVPPYGLRYFWGSRSMSRMGRGSGEMMDGSGASFGDGRGKQHPNSLNTYAADLYLPSMALLTYTLLYGLSKGTIDDFHPEVLSATASFSLILIFLEVLFSKLVLYLLGVHSISALELICCAGFKFLSLVVISIVGLIYGWSNMIHWVVFFYCSACASHAVFQSLSTSEYQNRETPEWGTAPVRPLRFTYSILLFAAIQIPLCWILTPTFSSKGGVVASRLASINRIK